MRTALVIALILLLSGLPALSVAPGGSSAVYALYPAPSAWASGAGEPSIGVNWNTGNVFFQNFFTTLRASFNDATMPATATWSDVTPPNSITNVDPILFTDATTGRTFAGGLNGQCSVMAYTDDDGASWIPMANPCASPAYDHESIGSGPFFNDIATPPHPAYSHIVYYCAQEVFDECSFSLDGGLTFSPAVPVSPTLVCASLHGSVHVGPNGVAFLPVRSCGDGTTSGLSVSKTNGRNWASVILPGGRPSVGGFDPDVATTPSGWAYVGYPGANGHPLVTLTKNNGTSFSGPWNVGASLGITNVSFTEMVAGDDSRATLVFLGTTQPGNAYVEGWSGEWNLYAATTLDAGATWDTVQITTDPVQRGWMCVDGINCPDLGTRGRNLLDFIDAQVDSDGRVVIAFADGCIATCATASGTAAESTTDYATIARQTCGPSLYAAVGDVAGTTPCSVTAPPPLPPLPLAGAYYMTGVAPVSQADTVLGIAAPVVHDTFKQTAPTGSVPKVASNVAIENGANARTLYDASWAIDAPGEGFALNDTTVTVHLFVVANGANSAQFGAWQLTLSLSDLRASDNAPMTGAFATTTKSLTLTPGVNEVVVTFPAQTRTLTNGFTLTVAQNGAGETDTLYDATMAPSRVVFS